MAKYIVGLTRNGDELEIEASFIEVDLSAGLMEFHKAADDIAAFVPLSELQYVVREEPKPALKEVR